MVAGDYLFGPWKEKQPGKWAHSGLVSAGMSERRLQRLLAKRIGRLTSNSRYDNQHDQVSVHYRNGRVYVHENGTTRVVKCTSRRWDLWTRQDQRCHYCKRLIPIEVATIDHKKPSSRGGKGHDNLACACHDCNSEKSDMTEAEYFKLRAQLEEWAKEIVERGYEQRA